MPAIPTETNTDQCECGAATKDRQDLCRKCRDRARWTRRQDGARRHRRTDDRPSAGRR
jgi:hypothetical protein